MENNKMMEDCKWVLDVVAKISVMTKEYIENMEMLPQEENLLIYVSEFGKRPISPEIMNDPDNLQIRQKRFDDNMNKLKRIVKFKTDLLSGAYDTKLDLAAHPGYFRVLGMDFHANRDIGQNFFELHPVAFDLLTVYLKDIDKMLSLVSGQEYPEDSNNCEHLCNSLDLDTIRQFLEELMSLDFLGTKKVK